jgi:hypothetical protein
MTRVHLAGLCVAAVMALLALGACSGSDGTASAPATKERDDSAAVMAAAVERLVTRDHTFGEGEHRFREYLILDRTDPTAGGAGEGPRGPARPLTGTERAAIAAVVEPLGPHRFIADADAWRTDDLEPRIPGAAIVAVGEPELGADTALAPVSLWCGGLCGTWLTYRVDRTDGAWAVTRTEGPVAIS